MEIQALMRIADVAAYLSTTPGAARKWLDRNKVPVVDLGRGRGLGLRWRLVHIEEVVRIISQGEPVQKPFKPVKFKESLIRGRNRRELLSELTDPSPVQ